MIRTEKRMRMAKALLVMNLCFIWGNSLMPGVVSQAISDWVERILLAFCPEEMETALTGLFQVGISSGSGGGWLRKLAHFLEFGCLGMCLAWLTGMLNHQGFWPVLWGTAAAFVDEGIQMITPERSPSIRDVGIDTCGVVAGILVLQIGYAILKKKKYHQYQS